jgi:hypothetical protein
MLREIPERAAKWGVKTGCFRLSIVCAYRRKVLCYMRVWLLADILLCTWCGEFGWFRRLSVSLHGELGRIGLARLAGLLGDVLNHTCNQRHENCLSGRGARKRVSFCIEGAVMATCAWVVEMVANLSMRATAAHKRLPLNACTAKWFNHIVFHALVAR